MSKTRPTPEPIEDLNKQFWQRCNEERLCFQQCSSCRKWRHIPRPMCSRCHSMDWQWAPSSGRGKIFSWTVTHAPLHPVFASQVPYAVIIVELDEGVKMFSGLRNLPPDKIEFGLPVEVIFERVTENIAMPYFQPLKS
jgi:uncharacterized protein